MLKTVAGIGMESGGCDMKALMVWWESFHEHKLPSALKAAHTCQDNAEIYRKQAEAFNRRIAQQN